MVGEQMDGWWIDEQMDGQMVDKYMVDGWMNR